MAAVTVRLSQDPKTSVDLYNPQIHALIHGQVSKGYNDYLWPLLWCYAACVLQKEVPMPGFVSLCLSPLSLISPCTSYLLF